MRGDVSDALLRFMARSRGAAGAFSSIFATRRHASGAAVFVSCRRVASVHHRSNAREGDECERNCKQLDSPRGRNLFVRAAVSLAGICPQFFPRSMDRSAARRHFERNRRYAGTDGHRLLDGELERGTQRSDRRSLTRLECWRRNCGGAVDRIGDSAAVDYGATDVAAVVARIVCEWRAYFRSAADVAISYFPLGGVRIRWSGDGIRAVDRARAATRRFGDGVVRAAWRRVVCGGMVVRFAAGANVRRVRFLAHESELVSDARRRAAGDLFFGIRVVPMGSGGNWIQSAGGDGKGIVAGLLGAH